MSQITKEQARTITAEIAEAVKAIFESHGLEQTDYRTTYGERYEVKLTAVTADRNELGVNENTREARDYLDMGSYYGLNDGLLGVKFKTNGTTYQFIGLAPRSPKYFILAKNEDGQTVKFTQAAVALINRAGELANA